MCSPSQWFVAFALLLSVAASGLASSRPDPRDYESRDYEIPAASPSDARTVASILRSVARQGHLHQQHPLQYDSPVIAIYTARHLDLRAFPHRDLRVKLSLSDRSAREQYQDLHRSLAADLRAAFGRRVVVGTPYHPVASITVY